MRAYAGATLSQPQVGSPAWHTCRTCTDATVDKRRRPYLVSWRGATGPAGFVKLLGVPRTPRYM
eukprot:scaffold1233_cov395-Prasinococcus_capsulatus_cf.AAC.17